MTMLPGRPHPLGATWDGIGCNFALFSQNATKVELCLFDSVRARKETRTIELKQRTNHVWHVYLRDVRPGQLYGYRVHGSYDPRLGHRFNPNKLLLDPYAKAVVRQNPRWVEAMFSYNVHSNRADLSFDNRDNAAHAPLGVVVDTAFTWGNDEPPRIPMHKTVVYEAHAKGLTQLHPDVPRKLRGTYLGLSSAPVIEHMKSLGVTTVELLPIHAFVDEGHLKDKNLTNYWGYNSLNYFAPSDRYTISQDPAEQIREFKSMVATLHSHGLEVILDVVYNHTCEGNERGPALSFKGIDNAYYYRLVPNDRRYYMNYTGCGNTLDVTRPYVLKMIMDSLRYWVSEMHVDGFRFDLTSALAREHDDFDASGSFFDSIQQDPVLSQVKLFAEPWDIGMGGYQQGNYPQPWSEWNGKFRDTVRSFWNISNTAIDKLTTRMAGSSDLFQHNGRNPSNSLNFITCHDGFTLQDLVSYNQKHNDANGEGNQDGSNNNESWNCGEEGDSTNPDVLELRARQKRNLMASLMLSLGTPMLLAGDEFSKTQKGNNNTYCQDNELNWINWTIGPDDEEKAQFLKFCQRLIKLKRTEPVLQRHQFLRGESPDDSGTRDVHWFSPTGQPMSIEEWHSLDKKALGILLHGNALQELDEFGNPISCPSLLIIVNGGSDDIRFTLPEEWRSKAWHHVLDTTRLDGDPAGSGLPFGNRADMPLPARSVQVLRFESSADLPCA